MGQLAPRLHGHLENATLTCRGFISGRKECLGSELVYDNQEYYYCMLVNEWGWSRTRVCLLRLEVDLGSVLESDLVQNGDKCIKGMHRPQLVSIEKIQGLKGLAKSCYKAAGQSKTYETRTVQH